MKLKSASEIGSLISKAIGGYCAAEREMHEAAWQCVAHAIEHGDTTLLQRLLEGVSKKQVARTVAAWVRHYGVTDSRKSIAANISKDGKVSVRVGEMEQRKQFPLEEAYLNPYYNVIAPVHTSTAFELSKSVLRLVSKAVEAGHTETQVRDAVAAAFKKKAA